jgi:hypothetical protein
MLLPTGYSYTDESRPDYTKEERRRKKKVQAILTNWGLRPKKGRLYSSRQETIMRLACWQSDKQADQPLEERQANGARDYSHVG